MSRKLILISLGLYGIGCGLSQSLMSLGGALFALMSFVGLLNDFPKESRERKATILALGWVTFSAVNLLARGWDERTGHTLGTLPLLLVPVTALLWPRQTESRLEAKDFEWPLALTSVALVVSVGRASWQFFVQGQQAYGFLRNPIYFAYNLLPACVVFAELALRRLRLGFFGPLWAGLISALCVLGLVCSVSRMALVCAAGYLALRALPVARRHFGLVPVVLALPLALGSGAALALWNPTVNAKVRQTLSSDDPSRHWRLVAWKHNWELFTESPLAGVGPERNGIDVAKMPQYAGHWIPHTLIFAHSIYFQSLADNGLVGTLLFAGFWIAFAIAAPLAWPVVALLAVSGLTENVFNNSKAAHAVYFYALLCAFIGASLQRRRADGPA